MSRAWITLLSLALLAGCSGEYLVTLPDAAGPASGEAVAVARLQRHEFLWLAPAVTDAVVVMWIDPDEHRAAYTDSAGYATARLPVSKEPGRYETILRHQDERGDVVVHTGRCYVLDGGKLILAVDWEAIEDGDQAAAAAQPLQSLAAAGVQIVYAAEGALAEPTEAHRWLTAHDLPDGPVLSWGWRRNWYFRREGLVGSLPAVREGLAGLCIVAAGDDDLGWAAAEMNMITMGVGVKAAADSIDVADWAALAKRVLAAHVVLGDRDLDPAAVPLVREALIPPE